MGGPIFKIKNFWQTELLETIDVDDTAIEISVADSQRLSVLATDEQYRLTLWDGVQDPEIVACTSNPQTGTLVVARGQESTTPNNWNAGTQVLSALTEEVINSALAAYIDMGVLLSQNYLRLTGGTLSGMLTLPATLPSSGLHATSKAYVDSLIGGLLSTAGGSMSGDVNMQNNRIVNLPSPVTDGEPVTRLYLDSLWNQVKDLKGIIVSGGTASAYTAVPFLGDLVLYDGLTLAVEMHADNDANATLNLTTLTVSSPKAIQIAAGVNVTQGLLKAKTVYRFTYDQATDVWLVQSTVDGGFYVPAGTILDYGGSVAPYGFHLCYGQAVSRTTYARLFGVIGTSFGVGDGSSTFNLPDVRGRVRLGKDDLGGTAANIAQVTTDLTTTASSTSASVASATGLCVGMIIVNANVNTGTYITAISGTTITLSSAATGSATATARFSLFSDAQTVGAVGGAITNTLAIPQMPAHDHGGNTGAGTPHSHTLNDVDNTITISAGATPDILRTSAAADALTTNTESAHTHPITSQGGGQPHANLQPSLVVNSIIKW